VAIAAMFCVNGFTLGSWLPRLPEIRAALEVSDRALGLTLVGGSIGGLVMSLLSGRIVDRVGSRRATVSTSLALALLLPLIALAPNPVVLFTVLIAIGALDGVTDVAQNAQAIELQERTSRSIMSRMHATWSIGTLLGGLAASRSAAFGVPFELQLTVTAVALAGVALVAGTRLLDARVRMSSHDGASPAGHLARPLLITLFVMGGLATLAEMPPTEWASLLMAERFDLSVGAAGLGFVAFAAGMVAGRLGGDRVVDRVGSEATRRGGGLIGGAGIVVVALSPSPAIAWLGFLVAGAGLSALFPMAIVRIGELTGNGSSVAVAAFSSGARAGMLIGSPLMGALSQATTRTTALLVIATTAAWVSALVRLPVAAAPPDEG
jgi:predicted MFS family arabinose efflux permease